MSGSADRQDQPDSYPSVVVPIEQHSLLSDQRAAALVSPDARVVWLCEPRVDAHPVLAELLGGPAAGFGLC